MRTYLNVLITSSVILFTTFPVFAMQGYDKLSIIAEVDAQTRNTINQRVKTDGAKALLPQDGTVKLARYPKSAYHISLDCFNHDYPADPTLHVQFGEEEKNYLYRVMARFANHPKRQQKGPYEGECYDIQLWCHVKTSDGQKNQHFHFSMIDRLSDGAFNIDRLPQVIAQTGGQVDYAHLVLRFGTQGTFRDDWSKLVHGLDLATGQSSGGIICNQDKEAKRPMNPYRVENELKTHITVARLEKPQADGTTIPFSGANDFVLLQNIYKSVSSQYEKMPLKVITLRVTTRLNGQKTDLGNPEKL